MINETRERFIRSIAEQLDPSRVVEVHFFPSIRQGPIETGVAVIAATPVPIDTAAAVEAVIAAAEGGGDSDAPAPELHLESAAAESGSASDVAEEPSMQTAPDAPERTEVFTATYIWTRKGPDRGKWVVEVKAQAHAPLPTVETVVRGVQVRAGEALDAFRMSGAELQELVKAGIPVATPA